MPAQESGKKRWVKVRCERRSRAPRARWGWAADRVVHTPPIGDRAARAQGPAPRSRAGRPVSDGAPDSSRSGSGRDGGSTANGRYRANPVQTTKRSGLVFCWTRSVTTGTRGRSANSQEWNEKTSMKARARRPSTERNRVSRVGPGFSPTAVRSRPPILPGDGLWTSAPRFRSPPTQVERGPIQPVSTAERYT